MHQERGNGGGCMSETLEKERGLKNSRQLDIYATRGRDTILKHGVVELVQAGSHMPDFGELDKGEAAARLGVGRVAHAADVDGGKRGKVGLDGVGGGGEGEVADEDDVAVGFGIGVGSGRVRVGAVGYGLVVVVVVVGGFRGRLLVLLALLLLLVAGLIVGFSVGGGLLLLL